MNKKKNGALEIISAVGGFDTSQFNKFLSNMKVSDHCHELWYGDRMTANNMKGDELEKSFLNPLKILNLGKQNFNQNDNITCIKKRKDPKWPILVHFFASDIEHLDLEQSSISTKRSMEVFACCLENPVAKTSIKMLNLSRNQIDKEGAKILADVLKSNGTIESLDLSGNRLGVSGTQAIAKCLLTNTTLKSLSLYSNKVDVDGARALKNTLVANDSLQYLDVGSNRLRENGIMAIAEGIVGNKTCALKSIGLRFNFISEDAADKFFNMVIGKSKIETIYIRNNFLSDQFLIKIEEQLASSKQRIYIDIMEKVRYLDQQRLDKSIWVSPLGPGTTEKTIVDFFTHQKKCGLITNVRVKTGKAVPGKPSSNIYAVVEYAHQNSVNRSLRVASKKQSVINGNRVRIYKAGSQVTQPTNQGTRDSRARPTMVHATRGGRGGRGRGRR